MKYKKLLLASLLSLNCVSTVMGGPQAVPFSVQSAITDSCSVNANALTFSAFNRTANVDAQTTIEVTCTRGTAYSVGIDEGQGDEATISNRVMTQQTAPNTEQLGYQISDLSDFSTEWGSTVGVNTVNGEGSSDVNGNVVTDIITVYGRVPLVGNETAVPDLYTDTLTVTVTF